MIQARAAIVTIGVDEDVVARIRAKVDRPVRSYPAPPRIEVRDGVTLVESARIAGKMFEAAGLVWHGYFDNVGEIRRALALSSTPSFPDIRATLPLDDRFVSLAMATRVDRVEEPRGVLRTGESIELASERVAKWGHRHCGDGKARVAGPFAANELTSLEPFVEGTSERVLVIGEAAWQLRYESEDWRKNVNARVTPVDPANRRLVARARRIADALALPMVGVDFVVRTDDAVLLEINAYPGLEDAPGAVDAFVDAVAAWAVNLDTFNAAARARWLAQTVEYREAPPVHAAQRALDDAGEKVVRAGLSRPRVVQVLLLESFGDFTSYEIVRDTDAFRVGRVCFQRKDDLAVLQRAPVTGLGPLVPTIERREASLSSEIGDAWLARLGALQVSAWPSAPVVLDGTGCELNIGSRCLTARWNYQAPPDQWRELQGLAEELISLVNETVAAHP
jgi:hypothetical protein